ncbi:MAG: acyl-CoA reductase [Gilvibacter sp.]
MALGLSQRIECLSQLGNYLSGFTAKKALDNSALPSYDLLEQTIDRAYILNGWFLPENQLYALESWGSLLTKEKLSDWAKKEQIKESQHPKTVAIVMAGNIPMVGFHDLLSVLISPHKALIKLSSSDAVLVPFLLEVLSCIDAAWKDRYAITEGKLENFDAVIATGSNNTARYFEHYFGKYPNVIRQNRNSVAVITGNETQEQLGLLGEDIFRYFGLGCRNVSKLFIPKGYDTDLIFKAIFPWKHLLEIKKYENNYDYNKAVFLMSQFDFLDNGFCMLKEDESFVSPIASIFYETYDSAEKLTEYLAQNDDKIQCVVGDFAALSTVPFGQAQRPALDDYADGVNTLQFLLKLG